MIDHPERGGFALDLADDPVAITEEAPEAEERDGDDAAGDEQVFLRDVHPTRAMTATGPPPRGPMCSARVDT